MSVPEGDHAVLKLVTSPAEFSPLKAEWNTVAAISPGGSVFLRHEWFDAAWQWRRLSARLFLLCLFRDGRLAAILPLVLEETTMRGLRVRELTFLTVPDTQRCDMVVADADRAWACDTIAAELKRRRGEWDVIRLKYLAPESVAGTTLRRSIERCGLTTRFNEAPGNLYVSLESGWHAYYSTRSRRHKKAGKLAANRLAKAGEVRIEWLAPGADPAALEAFLEKAIAISARSWKKRTGNSLDHPGPGAFIRRLSETGSSCGWISIWLLTVDSRPLAMEYQLIADGSVYALRSDFDEAYEPISPGSHLNRCLLERLFTLGLQRYFMGPGDNAYKRRWTDEAEQVHELHVYGKSLRARVLEAWETKLRPLAIMIRDRRHRAANHSIET